PRPPRAARAAGSLDAPKPAPAGVGVFTVGIGYFLAGGAQDLLALWHTLFGTALVAGGASALNQLLERRSDARMKRTRNRPLPARRLRPAEGLGVGLLLGAGRPPHLAAPPPH